MAIIVNTCDELIEDLCDEEELAPCFLSAYFEELFERIDQELASRGLGDVEVIQNPRFYYWQGGNSTFIPYQIQGGIGGADTPEEAAALQAAADTALETANAAAKAEAKELERLRREDAAFERGGWEALEEEQRRFEQAKDKG